MINVIALTQFAFLTLGIVFLKIMIQANSDYQISRYLNRIALWLFAIPIVWIAFASLCSHINRAPLIPRVAYWVGIIITLYLRLYDGCRGTPRLLKRDIVAKILAIESGGTSMGSQNFRIYCRRPEQLDEVFIPRPESDG